MQLNKKKTKALWIGASSKNKMEPLKFQCPKDSIKLLGTYLSHYAAANNNNNFYVKVRKMETKLNIWLSRDLTLFGRTMLGKSLGLSQLIYTASMLSVPERALQQTQSKLFAFLWKNKREKIKRQVLFRPLSKGGLSFPCDLGLLLLYAKQYHYACKTMQKKQDTSEFISKFIIQLEIDK